jgi:hypothetical protein
MKNLKLLSLTGTITLLLLTFIYSCKKGKVENDDTVLQGGGATDCNYPELDATNLPSFNWVLEGQQSDYQSYANNGYFKFGSDWLSDASYLCGGVKKLHNGWDIHRPNYAEIKGKEVYSAYGGTVKAVYNAGTGFAKGITIEHTDLIGDVFTTNYTHLDPLASLQGTYVNAGQLIGYVADLSANDHLHFSLRRAPYTNTSNRGALPKYLNDNNCSCGGDPVYPEYFVDPGKLNFQGSILPSIVLSTPTNNNNTTNIPINFTWLSANGINPEYRIQVSKNLAGFTETNGFVNNTDLVVNQNTSSNNLYTWNATSQGATEPPLSNTDYYWSVRVYVNGITSKFSTPYTFKTIVGGTGTPTALSATNILTTGFTCNWTGTNPITNGYYGVLISSDNSFTNIISGGPYYVTATNFTLTSLLPNTWYYYKVQTLDLSFIPTSPYSNVISVKTN